MFIIEAKYISGIIIIIPINEASALKLLPRVMIKPFNGFTIQLLLNRIKSINGLIVATQILNGKYSEDMYGKIAKFIIEDFKNGPK